MRRPERMTVRALVAWALSRSLVMLWWAYTPFGEAAAVDLNRYAHFATGTVSSLGLNWFPWEYPALARGVLGSSLGLDLVGYVSVFLLCMVAVDLAFTCWLLRPRQRYRNPNGVWLWIVSIPLLGVIPYTRYDMPVACAVALAIAWSGRRARTAAVLLSVAVALKLWPIVLIPLLVLRVRRAERPGVFVAAVLPWIIIELVGVLTWGTRSLTAPWTWQQDRGLQIESSAAGLLRILHVGSDPIVFRFNAWETTSPTWLLTLLTLTGAAILVLVITVSCRRLVNAQVSERQADDIVSAAACLVIAVLLVTGKVFSPQYLLWLIAPLTVAYVMREARDRWMFGLMSAICALTTLIYPVMYSKLIVGEALPWSVLQLRNVLLVLVVGLLVARWRASMTLPSRLSSESEANRRVSV